VNILSLLSAFSAYSFVLAAAYILRLNPKSTLNRTSALVNASFAVWSFCSIFFHSAPDLQTAWFWHRLGSLGWIPFSAFALHFFFILSGKADEWKSRRTAAFLYAVPLPLIAYSFSGDHTPLAAGLIRTSAGTGWTYLSNVGSPWFWGYAAYLVGYFAVGLNLARRWAKSSDRPRQRIQGMAIVWLDLAVIAAACYTDIAAPYFGLGVPPIANLLTVGWMAGFLYIISKYKLMTIYEAADADLVLKTIIDPVLLLDRNGIIVKCNKGCAELLKFPAEEIVGSPFSRFLAAGRYRKPHLDILFKRKQLSHIEIDLVDAKGENIHVLGSLSMAETKLDGPVGIVANLHDISALKRTQEELIRKEEEARGLAGKLHRLAHYDTLTDLPNRRFFFTRLSEALERHRRTGAPFIVAFADLDGFKAVNDNRGHDAGDALLATIADRLRAELAPEDSAARVGGDEFVVLLCGPRALAANEDARKLVEKAFEEPIYIGGALCPIGVSVGIARCPEDGTDTDALMKAADERMYAAKRSKKDSARNQRHFHGAG